MIEEERDAVPLGDMHHPILGMKSPYRTFSVQGKVCSCLLTYTWQVFCVTCISHAACTVMQSLAGCSFISAVQVHLAVTCNHAQYCLLPSWCTLAASLSSAQSLHQLHSCSERLCVVAHAEEGSATAADLAEAATRPTRQSSAIHFNAALGGWGNIPAVPARAPSAKHMHAAPAVPAAVKTVQSPVVQPLATASTTMTSQRVGQMGTVPVSSNQQESRPRSSDGILQRITVDRGPATGV